MNQHIAAPAPGQEHQPRGYTHAQIIDDTFGIPAESLRALATGKLALVRRTRVGGSWRYSWGDALLCALALAPDQLAARVTRKGPE